MERKEKQQPPSLHGRSYTPNSWEERRERERGKEKGKIRGRRRTTTTTKQPTASHPSVKGQRPQKRWIGMYTGNHSCPVPSFALGPHYWFLAFWL